MARAFTANNDGFRAIAVGPEIRKALDEVAEKAKGIAQGLAEEFRKDADPEDVYADSFEVVPLTVIWAGEYPGPRAAVQLLNSSRHAAAVEYGHAGSADDPHEQSAHHVLARTLAALEAGE